jgi:hypothetical protein
MQLISDEYKAHIHIFDMNGTQPDFSMHYPKSSMYPDHIFFLQDGEHFHLITNINGVIQKLQTFSVCRVLF